MFVIIILHKTEVITMPFLNPDHKPKIKHPQGYPVAVIAVFNTVGDLIPRYFCICDDNEERFTFKLFAIVSTKEKLGVITFECVYLAYGYRNFITISFDVNHHLWIIG